MSQTACFHCGLPVPKSDPYQQVLLKQTRSFCCLGCQSVAGMIHESGLASFYSLRDTTSPKPDEINHRFDLYDRSELQETFTHVLDDTTLVVDLLADTIHCAACVWLIEHALAREPSVKKVRVNTVTRHVQVHWVNGEPVSRLMRLLADIGYPPEPLLPSHEQAIAQKKQRVDLFRLGYAGFAMMQIGMVSAALYLGADDEWRSLFRMISLFVSIPVVFFSAYPFIHNAYKSIKAKRLIMDVPVAIAILLGFFASVWAVISDGGEVYFDSITMFTFFLLIGRYLEKRLRVRNQQTATRLTRLLPLVAHRKCASQEYEAIPLTQVSVGDELLISEGATIPCDGRLISDQALVTEAWLTGESAEINKTQGDVLMAGSINIAEPVILSVKALGRETRLSAIEQLVNQAQHHKPDWQLLADRVSRYFVAFVLVTAVGVFSVWESIAPGEGLWVALSVLVVTCPCALSLATPAALTASLNYLNTKGLLIVNASLLETLSHVKTIVFDKTGTLTQGKPSIESIHLLETVDITFVRAMASALEQGSDHPIASAFTGFNALTGLTDRSFHSHQGVSAQYQGQHYFLGKPKPGSSFSKGIVLTCDHNDIAHITLSDTLRPEAKSVVHELKQQGFDVVIASGDSPASVNAIAQQLAIKDAFAQMSPEQKTQFIRERQKTGAVLMVGDGINDAPVLAMADVSIAMQGASDLAKTKADGVLLSDNLSLLLTLHTQALRTRRTIKQNISWAIAYNLLALPLAALGMVPPYWAAAGMSLSSLIVVFNALRLYR